MSTAQDQAAEKQRSLAGKSDESLDQSEDRFRLLVDGVTDYAIFMLDPQGVS